MDPLSDVISFLEPRSYRVGGFEAGCDWSIRFGPYEGDQMLRRDLGRVGAGRWPP
jgi:hypothetical protein